MHFIAAVFDWLTTAANWRGPDGALVALGNQVELSAVVIALTVLLGVGFGLVLGHSGREGPLRPVVAAAVNLVNALRAVPSLALLTLLAIQPAISLRWDGFLASSLALVALGVPPVLLNTYVGVREVDPETRDAAKGMGMRPRQILARVEAPLALPLIAAGVRTAAVEIVATATLAAYVSFSDLGEFIFAGLNTQNNVEAFGGAFLVACLAGATDLAFGGLQRLVTPLPLRNRMTLGRGVVATWTRHLAGTPRRGPVPGVG